MLFEQHSKTFVNTLNQNNQLSTCVNGLRRQLRDRQTTENIKSDIRKFLRDVSYFKYEIVDRLPYHRIISEDHEDYKVNEVMSEIKDMGVEFVEALRCILVTVSPLISHN